MLIGIDGNEANVKERVGSNVYAFELIRAIEELDRKNEYVIYLREKKRKDLPQKREKYSYRIIPPKFLWTQWRLPLDLYLHQPRPKVFFTPGHYAPRFSPVPSVISILDLSFLKYAKSFKPAVLRQLKKWTERSARKATNILTISQATKEDIVEHYDVSPEKITVTYPGVGSKFLKFQQQAASNKQQAIKAVKRKYKIAGKYLLFLGTRQPKKNVPRLVEAFNSIFHSLSNPVTLVIAGKTWGQFAKEKAHKAHKSIKEIGYVKDKDLPALMKGAEAFVLPSLYEGFGMPVVEAMAVGTPTVVSKVSSLPEIVEDAGILVDPESVESIIRGIQQVLGLTREKRVQLVKKGKKQAAKFTWEKCAKKTLKVLYDVAISRQNGKKA